MSHLWFWGTAAACLTLAVAAAVITRRALRTAGREVTYVPNPAAPAPAGYVSRHRQSGRIIAYIGEPYPAWVLTDEASAFANIAANKPRPAPRRPGLRRPVPHPGGHPMMTTAIDRNDIILAKGSHDWDEEEDCGNPERCLFEWFNWISRHQHTHECPPDVSVVLHTFGMRLNDCLPDDRRQDLRAYLPNGGPSRLSGTRGDGLDETRSYMALDWLIRTYTPTWLDLAGLNAEAAALRDLRRIVDLVAAQAAGPVVRDASEKAAAAWAAARAAAWDAAWDAAWAAARAAAWDAAWAAARAAAGAAVQPTVERLQDSALDLFEAMIHPAAAS